LQEAEEAIVETQYGWALGTLTEKNVEERRRLAQWAELNPALCQLFHHLHALSEDVDYSRSV
jgi:hypothetical protein